MNVWEHTPLSFEFLAAWSLPASPAWLAEAKRETVVIDGQLCSRTKTVYDYIGDHLGYRFELTQAEFSPEHTRTQPLAFEATVINRGFAAMHNPRQMFLVLICNDSDEIVFRSLIDQDTSGSVCDWQPYSPGDPAYIPMRHRIIHTTQGPLPPPGSYRIGLYLPDQRAVNMTSGRAAAETTIDPLLDKEFCVRFANQGIEWWSDSKGQHGVNVLGTVTLK